MQYDNFMYIYPPRPTTAVNINSAIVAQLRVTGNWIGQLKLNGQRNLIFIAPDGSIQLWNRHKEQHRNYISPNWLLTQLSSIRVQRGKWSVIDSELLHAKDATIKNTIYLYDILVLNGEYLIGTTYRDRYNLLLGLVNPTCLIDYKYRITDNFWMAYNVGQSDWNDTWKLTSISYIEGLVFKNLNGILQPGLKEINNSGWMVRCRKPNKIYQF